MLIAGQTSVRAHVHTCWLRRELLKPEFLKFRKRDLLRVKLFLEQGMNYCTYPRPIPLKMVPLFLSHTALRRETRGLSVKIYFFIPAHLVALLSEVNILFNLFTSGKLRRAKTRPRNFARELQRRANFRRVSRAPSCTKVKNLPDNKRGYFQFAPFASPACVVHVDDRSAWQRYNFVWLWRGQPLGMSHRRRIYE